jgi:DegV family protein with EDD domain
MARTIVVTDSSACVPSSLASAQGLRVVSIRVHVGEVTFRDGQDEAGPAVYRALAGGQAVKSSSPSASDYLLACEDGPADAAVVITPPAEFTAMHQSAVVASRLSTRPTLVLDCRAVAAGQALVVLAAAEAATRDAAATEVLRTAEDASRRCEMLAVLENVGPIAQSGRVAPSLLKAAERGGNCPVFRFRSGAVELVDTPRGWAAACSVLVERWEALGGRTASSSAVFHAVSEDRATELATRVGTDLVTEFSPAMGIHTGPGVVGAAWLRQPGE